MFFFFVCFFIPLYAYCCHLCEIQGIFREFCLGEIMAHCQTAPRPQCPRESLIEFLSGSATAVTVRVARALGIVIGPIQSGKKKKGWVAQVTAVAFVSSPRSRARAALMMLMLIFICLFIKISAAYIILKMHPFYLNLLKSPDALKMTCGSCIAALMDFHQKSILMA